VADIGSPVTGVLAHIGVDRGDSVAAGQTLAVLRGEVERAQAGVAEARARVDADVRAAAASLALAQQKVVRARQLLAQQFVSQQALDQAQAEADVAAERLAQARSQQAISQRERDAALAQLGQRTLRSPLSGIVVERYAHPGERVEDRPVLRVARIDPLRVELMVPVAQYGVLRPGDRVAIRPELPGNPVLSATVRLVDKVVDPASNTYRVRLALPNPDQRLPAGLRCRADLPPSAVAAAPAGVQPAAASALQPATQPATQPAARRGLPPAIQPAIQPATQRTTPPAAGPATPLPAPAAMPHSAQPGATPVPPGGPAGLRMSPLLRLPGGRPARPQVPQVPQV
jgi:RND family efflux transporter MFP subunit